MAEGAWHPDPVGRHQYRYYDGANWTDPLNRNADYAPPYQAVRHDLRTNGTFELPVGPGKLLLSKSSGWLARIIEHWQTGVIFNVTRKRV